MNSEKLHTSWNLVCDQVKKYDNIDQMQVNAFFSRIHPQAMSDGFLMLTADNEFIRTWIERNYINYIKQALFDMFQMQYVVTIEVDKQSDGDPVPQSIPFNDPVKDKANEKPVSSKKVKDKENIHQDMPSSLADYTSPKTNSRIENEVLSHPLSSLTFESFVIGSSNMTAYSMAVAVAETPGKKQHLNPLFIYGKSGLGKTHLLCAIQNYIRETYTNLKTVYVDSAELLNDYTEASVAHDKEKSSFKNFKNRYEEADVLLIDDVQYLQGKKQTLDIVFQIFNKLTSQGKQIVLSADRAPKNIDIDERYASRFNSGGTSYIQPPDVETKLGIVKNFIEEYKELEGKTQFDIPEDIQNYIAENSSSNIRELKSAVTKVIYQITFFNQPNLSLEDVKSLLENHFSGGSLKRLSIADIQKEVESFYKVSHSDLVGKKRTRDIINARQIGIYLCRQMLDIPFNDIGKKFNRDHSTVMYSVTNVEEKMKENRELKEEIETLKQLIREL